MNRQRAFIRITETIFTVILLLFCINPVLGDVFADFETGCIVGTPFTSAQTEWISGWEHGCSAGAAYSGTAGRYFYGQKYGTKTFGIGYEKSITNINLDDDYLLLDIKINTLDNNDIFYVILDGSSAKSYEKSTFFSTETFLYQTSNICSWKTVEIDVSGYSGNHKLYIGCTADGLSNQSAAFNVYFDNVRTSNTTKLYGYITNNLGNTVSSAIITLNNSGGSTTSNDTGYYEITGISSGTYSITATSPTHNDYSDTVSISADIEKNITMTRLSPVLTWTDAETTKNDVYLKWRRNIVVDNIRIYKDTETRLLTTVASGSYLSGLYSDRNLDCNKGYVYWLQPMDGDVTGPKYRIDAKTDPCDGGGGGGDPTPTPSPTATPGPTPPSWTNVTQEEWLNLTLDQKQEILTNLTMFPPLLEFQWEDIYVWGIHLFLILCGAVALDSITIQKVSEYTGLWAILPGVMFAYLTGYLVI